MAAGIKEELLPLVEAIEKATGKRINPGTAMAWTTPKENEPHLEIVVCTTPEAVCRYFEALHRKRGINT